MAKAGTATELGTERIGKLLMQYAIPVSYTHLTLPTTPYV